MRRFRSLLTPCSPGYRKSQQDRWPIIQSPWQLLLPVSTLYIIPKSTNVQIFRPMLRLGSLPTGWKRRDVAWSPFECCTAYALFACSIHAWWWSVNVTGSYSVGTNISKPPAVLHQLRYHFPGSLSFSSPFSCFFMTDIDLTDLTHRHDQNQNLSLQSNGRANMMIVLHAL